MFNCYNEIKTQVSLRAFGKQSQTLWLLEIATLPASLVARNDICYGGPMSKLDWLTQEINGLKEQGLYNNIRTIGSAQGARLVVDGKDVLNFCSNNYLGLANHPKIVEAAKDATKKYGVGPAAVRSIAGTTDLHIQLEQRLAKFKGEEDVIFSDRLNHASIIDGSRLSGAKIVPYEHNDSGALEDAIKDNASKFR